MANDKPLFGNGANSANGNGGNSKRENVLPDFLLNRVYIDEAKKVIFIDQKTHSNPHFETWKMRNKNTSNELEIKICNTEELQEIKMANGSTGKATTEDQKIVREAIELIKCAAEYGASDIHFKVAPPNATVQFVIKGELRSYKHMTSGEGSRIIRATYQGVASSRAGSFNPLEFQNAQITGNDLPKATGITSVRIIRGTCYPESEGGEFMTMRLQYANNKHATDKQLTALTHPTAPKGKFTLLKMGYDEHQIKRLERLMSAPNGIVLFVGPTGSGKTTTVFECLQKMAQTRPESRQVTVEDPVEYPMSWAVQLGISDTKTEEETGKAFLERVRVMLRMAPNTILLGEIRGAEVGIAALNAALTGHLVLTTLHVNDPFLFVDRLELMDTKRLNRKVFCDPKIVRGVIAQRLLPHLCAHCALPLTKSDTSQLPERIESALDSWARALKITEKKLSIKGKGCAHCQHSGSSGRFAVAEIVDSDDQLMSDLIEHGTTQARRNYRARKDTDTSMLEKSIRLALAGKVSPLDVEKFIDIIEPFKEGL